MKRYDCSKVLDYIHELRRLCDHESCRDCPFDYMEDCNNMDIDQSMIDTLQKWSDGHPEKTRAEAFLELVPTHIRVSVTLSDGRQIDRPYCSCWGKTIGRNDCCYRGFCNDCWGAPYNGEFEKEEKDES